MKIICSHYNSDSNVVGLWFYCAEQKIIFRKWLTVSYSWQKLINILHCVRNTQAQCAIALEVEPYASPMEAYIQDDWLKKSRSQQPMLLCRISLNFSFSKTKIEGRLYPVIWPRAAKKIDSCLFPRVIESKWNRPVWNMNSDRWFHYLRW